MANTFTQTHNDYNNAINRITVTPKAFNVNNPVQAKRSSGWKNISFFPQLRQELNTYGVQEKRERLHTPSCACGLHGVIGSAERCFMLKSIRTCWCSCIRNINKN